MSQGGFGDKTVGEAEEVESREMTWLVELWVEDRAKDKVIR